MSHELRKTVTVLFSDVVGWTAMGETLDPETLRVVQTRYFDEVQLIVERHGGVVEKFIGDAVMAVFGVPAAHEDDALRAVRSATAMQKRLAALSVQLEDRGVTSGIQARIGVNTGEVITGDDGGRHRFVTGDIVNVAKRFEESATAGEILIGETTRALVIDAAELEPVGRISLKGKSEPVSAWRVVSVSAVATGVRQRSDTPLVNRVDEFARLRAVYRQVVDERRARLITVLGSAGIGKSKLATEMLLETEDAVVVIGRCLPYGEGITFWPVVEIIRSAGGDAALARARERGDGDAADALAGLLSPAETNVASSDAIFLATRRLLEILSEERPLVVCVDDIHWGEPTFLDLIEYLAGFIQHSPVMFLCLARPELAEARPTWLAGDTVQLEPLAAEDAGTLLDSLGVLDDEARQRILMTAEGNPLFAEQLAALTFEGGAVDLPPTIQALLGERLDRLEPEERIVVEHAAVVGREFTRGNIAELVPESLKGSLGSQLLALTRKGLVDPDHTVDLAEDGFRFRHILIRDAAYAAMPKALRAALHERHGGRLDASGRPGLEAIVGYHLEQAFRLQSDLGLPDRELGAKAGECLAAAGRRALARGDARAASNLLGRAAAVLADNETRRLELLPDHASALIRSGDLAAADQVLQEAGDRASAASDERIRLRVLVEREFIRSWTHPEAGTEGLVRVGNDAIAGLEPLGDDVGLAKAWWLVSEAHSVAGRWRMRAVALERALDHARGADSGEAPTLVALLAQALYYGPTPVDDAFARCCAFLEDAEGDRALEAALRGTIAGLQAMRGEFDAARARYRQAVDAYEELGHDFRRASRCLIGGEIELLAGDPAAAAAELRYGHDILERMGEVGVRSTISAYLARALAKQGADDDAERYIRFSADAAGDDDIFTQVVRRSAEAAVLSHRGDADKAEALAREAVVFFTAGNDSLDLRASAFAGLAEVLAGTGKRAAAADAANAAVGLYEQKGNLAAARRAAALATDAGS